MCNVHCCFHPQVVWQAATQQAYAHVTQLPANRHERMPVVSWAILRSAPPLD